MAAHTEPGGAMEAADGARRQRLALPLDGVSQGSMVRGIVAAI